MSKIVSIVGARPQFIKLAPLSKEIRKQHREMIIHTGQHFNKEMSDAFFSDLDIAEPDYNLEINSGLHGEQTGRMIIELEKVLINEEPGIIIVFGDTNSTLAGSVAGAKLGIPIIHVEAGLRSFNKKMPEEINRIISDHTSDYLFAPTKTAFYNLTSENLEAKSYLTGDIMVDAHCSAVERAGTRKITEELSVENGGYYLLTLHRPYNVDEPANLSGIIDELGKLEAKVVFPVHPRTRKIIDSNNLKIPENFVIIKPVGYLDFVHLQSNCIKIITDSGGIQKEAYILKKPCVTLRSETEWIETVEADWNLLINPSFESHYSEKIKLFEPPPEHSMIFGENVSQKMVEIINRLS